MSPRLILLFAILLLSPATLHAQLPKIFVASFGNDANDGTRNSPKRNFQAAHNAVATGGQIVALDTAGYGALAITKSVSVTVPPGVNGFVTVSGTSDGVSVNASTSAVVSLRGLIIEGGGSTGSGILSNAVGALRVEDCTIRDFAIGINFFNSSGGHLVARGCSLRDTKAGIAVRMAVGSGGATVTGVATDCTVDGATDTQFGAAYYVEFLPGGAFARFTLTRCTATNSAIGLKAQGVDATLYADACVVSGCTTGVTNNSAASTASRANNVFTNNTNDGNFTLGLTGK